MSNLATLDANFAEYCEQMDAEVLKRIQRSMLWSMDTWGGTRCSECGLVVPPRCQTDLGGSWFDKNGKRMGVFQGYGPACNSPLFFDKCLGENPNWMMEQSDA